MDGFRLGDANINPQHAKVKRVRGRKDRPRRHATARCEEAAEAIQRAETYLSCAQFPTRPFSFHSRKDSIHRQAPFECWECLGG